MLSRILGTGAPAAADANLILQMILGVALATGAMLARMKKYAAHAICQSAVLAVNAVAIALVMWPSFHHTVLPRLPVHWWHRAYYLWPVVHGASGAITEMLGVYIALAAATPALAQKVKFCRWKLWMRVQLALWWVVLLTGVGTYLYWYTAFPLP